MKNTKIFETIRLQAIELNELLQRQMEDSSKLELIAYRAYRDNQDYAAKREAFHEQCRKSEQIKRRIENNKPFMTEKWYMTEYLHSDAHAYEVVEVYSQKRMDVRRLKATEQPEAKAARLASFIPGGFCGHFDNGLQEWDYESDESNPVITVRQHKDGRYYRAGSRTCPFVPEDGPYEFRDFNF